MSEDQGGGQCPRYWPIKSDVFSLKRHFGSLAQRLFPSIKFGRCSNATKRMDLIGVIQSPDAVAYLTSALTFLHLICALVR